MGKVNRKLKARDTPALIESYKQLNYRYIKRLERTSTPYSQEYLNAELLKIFNGLSKFSKTETKRILTLLINNKELKDIISNLVINGIDNTQVLAPLGIRIVNFLTDVGPYFKKDEILKMVLEGAIISDELPPTVLNNLESKFVSNGVGAIEKLQQIFKDKSPQHARVRAEMIARGEIQKSYGDLIKEHFLHNGVSKYIWRGVLDFRERFEHKIVEGQVFDFRHPPFETGFFNPGEAYNCRCWAEPIFDNLIYMK